MNWANRSRDLEAAEEEPSEAADAALMRALRRRLDDMAADQDNIELTRKSALDLLDVLRPWLDEVLELKIGEIAERDVVAAVAIQHPAGHLLEHLVGAMRDLDNGKTHPALKRAPPKDVAIRSKTFSQRRGDEVVLECVNVVELRLRAEYDAKKIRGRRPSWQDAAALVANALRKRRGRRSRGLEWKSLLPLLSASQLKNLKDNRGRKTVSQSESEVA